MTTLFTHPSVLLKVDEATLLVEGDVDVTLAADLAASGVEWLNATNLTSISLDFSRVNKASSVAISVLFEWLRSCQRRGIKAHSIHLSPPLKRLASLAELDDLIAHPETALAV